MRLLLLSLWASLSMAQLYPLQPGQKPVNWVNVAVDPTIGADCKSQEARINYLSGAAFVCKTTDTNGATGTWTQIQGASTSSLVRSGIGVNGLASANTLQGPANIIVATDDSGNGTTATAALIAEILGTVPVQTATALAATPTPCTSGQFAQGVDASGNSIGCGAGGTVPAQPNNTITGNNSGSTSTPGPLTPAQTAALLGSNIVYSQLGGTNPAAAGAALGATAAQQAANLSDLANAATARTNLGLSGPYFALPTVTGDGTLNAGSGALAVSKIAGVVPGTLFPLSATNTPLLGAPTIAGNKISGVRVTSLPSSCVAGTDPTVTFNSGGIDAGYYCDNTGHYALPPGGSTTSLVGAATGPATTNSLRDLPSVRDAAYGLVPDLVHMADAVMTSGSGVLTTAHTFVSGDVGKTCVVGGAGAEGPGANLRTTIASVTSGHATLTATATNTVTTQLADCGTLNEFLPIILATAGTGFVVPSGAYLVDNTGSVNAGGGFNLNSWTNGGTIQFQTGASITCVATGTTGALNCIGGANVNHVTIVNPVVGFAGATIGPKASGGTANGISFNNSTFITLQSPTVNSTGAGSCVINTVNTNFTIAGTLTMNGCNKNGSYNVSSQDTTLGPVIANNTGDYGVEVDTATSADGFTMQGLHCNNVFGCLLMDGMQKGSVTDIQATQVCGGVTISNGFGTPQNIDIGKIVIDGSGSVANPNWPSCTTLGSGAALQIKGGNGVHVGSARITNTSSLPLKLDSNADVSIDVLSYSGITSSSSNPLTIVGSNARILNFHVDTSTVNLKIGDGTSGNKNTIFGSFWDFKNICTAATCAGIAVDFPTNTQINLSEVVLRDDQATPTGYIIRTQSTTNASTIANVQANITNGTASANLDANVCLDCVSFGGTPGAATLSSVGNPTVNKTFTSPNTTLTFTGTAPGAVAGTGTNAAQTFSVVGTPGGNTTGTTGQSGGVGSSVTLTGGQGGQAPSGSTNGAGGPITINAGVGGGGAGTAGQRGVVALQTGGGQVVVGNGTGAGSAAMVVRSSGASLELGRTSGNDALLIDSSGTAQMSIRAIATGGGGLYNAGGTTVAYTWDGSGNSFFGTAKQGEITAAGLGILPSYAGTGTATFAPQTGAGSGATAVCATSHVCDSFSGEVTLTSGTVPAIGSDLIITLPVTRTNQPNCAVELKGGTLFLGDTKTVTTSTITISTVAALAAATAYTIDYVCGGN